MLDRLRRGDPAGLEALMDRYTPLVCAVAARALPGRAQEWGVPPTCYPRCELAHRIPPAWFAAKAAAYFHTSMEQLFTEGGKQNE